MRAGLALLLALLPACQPTGPSRVDAPADTAAGEIPFRLAGPTDAAIVLPVRLNGQGPYDFVLDTGATLTCVNRSLADSLRLPEREGMRGFGAGVATQGRVRLVGIDSLRVGGAAAFDLVGCVLDLEGMQSIGLKVDGLLGLNFLKPFRVALDFQREVLTLEGYGSEPLDEPGR